MTTASSPSSSSGKAPSTAQWLAMLEQNLEDLENYQHGRAFKALFYGASGVGKTVQAIAIAQAITSHNKTILYLDSGNGWVSLDNHPELKTRVNRIQIGLITTLEGVANLIQRKAGSFGTVGCVIVDEYSTIVDNDLSMIVSERAKKDDNKDPDTATQPDYNTSKSRGVKYANQLFLLGDVHVILVAHERQDKDSRNILTISPLFNPKLGARLREAVHLVTYLSIKEVRREGDATKKDSKRVFQVHPSTTIVAKTRIGGLQPEVDYDTLKARLVKWVGEKQEKVIEMTDDELEKALLEENFEGTPVTE